MPLPSSIADLSQTPGSNSPAGSESPITTDDYLRYYASYIATLRDGKGFTNPVSLASATTTDIGAQNAMSVEVTGTTTITGFGTTYNGPRFLRFTGILTLTHHATNLNLPGAANITTAAGDTCIVVPNSTPNGWNVVHYQLAANAPGVVSSATSATTATNLAGGAADQVPYQTGAGATAFRYKSERIQPVDYSLSGNALTLKLDPTTLDFRSTTLTSGTPTTISNASQITTTISSGSTGGTTSAVQSDIILLAINNAGTMELAWVNASGGVDLSETGLISTTAEGGAGGADSASTIYSTTARTNVAYRVVGFFRSTQTTAGTWAQTPSLMQGAGGQAVAAMASAGFGQTWQDVTGSRAGGTTYYNTTGKEIDVLVSGVTAATTAFSIAPTVNGTALASCNHYGNGAGYAAVASFKVPPGQSYSVAFGSCTLQTWSEKR